MASHIIHNNSWKVINTNPAAELSLFVAKLRNSIWLIGIPSWLFGITDRSLASMADGYLSAIEIVHLFTAFFFFMSWLCLKPAEKILNSGGLRTIRNCFDENPHHSPDYFYTAKTRMLELQEQHLISQEYILPFPYFCQIYHLLNLKHLETIHNFSLNNLKVIQVSQVQPTETGGLIKFQTVLDSPTNALRIWRQPIVEAGLTLHNPYTVELCIPVYSGKFIVVIFNALPIAKTEHKFFIDIYSNLQWPRFLFQIILHFAACLTLFEDLPYLEQLAKTNISRLIHLSRVSTQETTWLFRRFVELYGSILEPSPARKAIEPAHEP